MISTKDILAEMMPAIKHEIMSAVSDGDRFNKQWLTVKEAAAYMSTSPRKVRFLTTIPKGIEGSKPEGMDLRVSKKSIDDYWKRNADKLFNKLTK